MKTATLPPLRVEPQLRKHVERLLEPGETLSTFVERAVRESVDRRSADADFATRALASREESRKSGRYHSAAAVLRDLEAQTKAVKLRQGKRK